MIAVVDYHKGNLKSVERGIAAAGGDARITDDAALIARAEAVVLPGVGAFADAAATMQATGQMDAVRECIAAGVPFLGICLGMHLMFEEGVEGAPEADDEESSHNACGLSILPGVVCPLPRTDETGQVYKIPHVGWNSVVPPFCRTAERADAAGASGTGSCPSVAAGRPEGQTGLASGQSPAPEAPSLTLRTTSDAVSSLDKSLVTGMQSGGGAMSTKRVPHEPNSPVGCSCEQDCLSDWASPHPPTEQVERLGVVGIATEQVQFSSPLFADIEAGTYFYFTHSYIAPTGPFAIAQTTHSATFPSAVQYGDVAFGVQFHPEKSSDAGMRLLRNFVNIVKGA